MRDFPHAPRRPRLAALAAAFALAGALVIPTAYADPSAEPSAAPSAEPSSTPSSGGSGLDDQGRREQRELLDQQAGVEADISSAEGALDESTDEVSSTGAALLEAQSQLRGARTHLSTVQEQLEASIGVETQLQVQLSDTRAQLVTARADLVAGRAAVAVQRQSVADTVSSIYTQGDPQLLALSAYLDAESPAELTRQMNLADVVVGKQDLAYDDLRAAEAQLAEQERTVSDAKTAVRDQHHQAKAHVEEVEALQAEAEAAEADVSSLVDTRAQARQVAVAAQSADQQALEDVRRQDAVIKRKILRVKKEAVARIAAAAAAAAAAQAAADQAAAAQAATAAAPVATDGLLLAPVVGPVTSPFGYRIHPIYGYWGLHDGTDFGVACGEGLRAAGDGTVLSTYYSSVYGNRLYLDLGIINGKAITVVYNHMSGYAKNQGDVVERGDIVGYVGSTGWSTGCHLHFTVLEDGEAVDPMGYL